MTETATFENPLVGELLDKLFESDLTPEEVCLDRLDLLPTVREQWGRICRARTALDEMFPTSPHSIDGLCDPKDETNLPSVPGYVIESVLGRGGMGVVFRARHLRLNRLVALKMSLSNHFPDRQERDRFQREAESVAALHHANIVQIHDVGDASGRSYFTMELVEGGTLSQKLFGTPLPARQAAELLATLTRAVQAAHGCGIIHRDLKPANVLLTADGTPKISDFGLARRVDHDSALTGLGMPLGTPSYMAPEQARGTSDKVDPTVDVYSLGAILYELITGRPPFCGESSAETIQQVLHEDPVQPGHLNPRIPRDLETICLKCLQKEPEDRYATAATLEDDLNRFLRGDEISARRDGWGTWLWRRVRRRPWFSSSVAAVTLVVTGLAGGGLWLLLDRAATSRAQLAATEAKERGADEDLDEMVAALGTSAWPSAEAALARARVRLGEDAGTESIRRRMNQGAEDLQRGRRLEAIRLDFARGLGGVFNYERLDKTYETAFREFGYAEIAGDLQPFAERIRKSDIRSAIVAAFDNWSGISIMDAARRKWILDLTELVDDDPTGWRHRARRLEIEKGGAEVEALLAATPFETTSVSQLLAIHRRIPHGHARRIPFLKRVQEMHPGDLWANFAIGVEMVNHQRPQEAARYFQAITALRPDVAIGYHNLAFALSEIFREGGPDYRPQAIDAYRRAIELNPAPTLSKIELAKCLCEVERHDEAIALIEEILPVKQDVGLLYCAYGISLEKKGRDQEAEKAYREGVRQIPDVKQAHTLLRTFLMQRGRLEDVRQVWEQALELRPSKHDDWYGYAELCAYLGRKEEYRRARGELVARFGNVDSAQTLERASRACLLLDESEDAVQKAMEMADRAATADPERFRALYPWLAFVKGVAEFRRGNNEAALRILEGPAARYPFVSRDLIRAMILLRTGQDAKARELFATAVATHDWNPANAVGHEQWIHHVYRREAESKFFPELSGLLEGSRQPRDVTERVALLGVLQAENRTLGLARMYARILPDPPQQFRGDQFDLRLKGARAALQAGMGQGADAAALTPAERADLRAQVRRWMREDLAVRQAAIVREPGSAPLAVYTRLKAWQSDPDFDGLRNPERLKELSAEEQQDCRELWREVDELIRKCRGGAGDITARQAVEGREAV